MTLTHLPAAFAILMATGAAAQAQVCVHVDETKDTLSEPERKATVTFLSEALARQGLPVAGPDCPTPYTVYHVKFGNSVTVYLYGPQGSRQATARSLEDVPPLYDQMVRSLVSGLPMSSANNTVDRTNVTTTQMAPNRVEADSLWYLRLGYGALLGSGVHGGPAFGFGYRYELDNLGIDTSFLNITLPSLNNSERSGQATGSFIKLMGLYFLNPVANNTFYGGAGISWGGAGLIADSLAYAGSGIQGELSVGYELLRASTIRMFTQFDVTLPFYTLRGTTSSGMSDSRYAPNLVLSLGVGWGHSRTVTVRTIN